MRTLTDQEYKALYNAGYVYGKRNPKPHFTDALIAVSQVFALGMANARSEA